MCWRFDRLNTSRAALLTLACALVSAGAAAQSTGDDATRATARQLGEQGLEAFWAQDYKTANEKLERAFKLFSTPTLGLYSARSKAKLGQWVEAAERYRETSRASASMGDSAAQQKAQAEATRELEALEPTIPRLTIQVQGGADSNAVKIALDGAALPNAIIGLARPTNPGAHRIRATLGSKHVERDVQLAPSQKESVTLAFPPPAAAPAAPIAAAAPAAPIAAAAPAAPIATTAPAAPIATTAPAAPIATTAPAAPIAAVTAPPPTEPAANPAPETSASEGDTNTVPIVLVAVGGASLVTSAITAIAASAKLDDCPDNECANKSDAVSYETLKTFSTLTFYLGLGCGIAGAVVWLMAPTEADAPEKAVSWNVGPGSLSVHGKF